MCNSSTTRIYKKVRSACHRLAFLRALLICRPPSSSEPSDGPIELHGQHTRAFRTQPCARRVRRNVQAHCVGDRLKALEPLELDARSLDSTKYRAGLGLEFCGSSRLGCYASGIRLRSLCSVRLPSLRVSFVLVRNCFSSPLRRGLTRLRAPHSPVLRLSSYRTVFLAFCSYLTRTFFPFSHIVTT